MAGRANFNAVICAAMVGCLTLTACGPATTPSVTAPGASAAEEALASQAAAMQKTILEGAAVGGIAGAGLGMLIPSAHFDSRDGFSIGVGGGAVAGTYVAHVQRKYRREEDRLRAIKADLDRNAAEMQATIAVMNQVLASQTAELTTLRASGDAAAMTTEVAQATDNLAQMQRAINGASARQDEFLQARNLTLAAGETVSPIDGDLAALSQRIAQMQGIANDLATAL